MNDQILATEKEDTVKESDESDESTFQPGSLDQPFNLFDNLTKRSSMYKTQIKKSQNALKK